MVRNNTGKINYTYPRAPISDEEYDRQYALEVIKYFKPKGVKYEELYSDRGHASRRPLGAH